MPRSVSEGPSHGNRSGGSATPAADEDAGVLVGRIIGGEGSDARQRSGLMARLARVLASGARTAGVRGVASGRWLTETFTDEVVPRIPVRDHATLVRHHNGLDGEGLAEALERNASRATTTTGVVGGALAAAQFTAPPLLLSTPAQLAAETLVVAAVEVKLVAELHECYHRPAQGSATERGLDYVLAWAHNRGVAPLGSPESVTTVLGATARTALRKRLMLLFGRQLGTLGPYLSGAVAGGTLNRAATRSLVSGLRAELRPSAPSETRQRTDSEPS
ncbi:hypothetical protein FHX37_1865 [Haloactinospora alba]|uniref:EcsC family protein n=1 Tax=Haloactinospora alba TaxID=405555 RepID=A0A543NJ90_9ACTN|nr:hypothetical protein [Haloactinospora alba]TQN31941.1 hypothetical protein FHX37_1865 [Haloactinospora alba]